MDSVNAVQTVVEQTAETVLTINGGILTPVVGVSNSLFDF